MLITGILKSLEYFKINNQEKSSFTVSENLKQYYESIDLWCIAYILDDSKINVQLSILQLYLTKYRKKLCA